MSQSAQRLNMRSRSPDQTLDWEIVVIGAGVGGIYQIKKLIDLGVRATVLEAGEDLGLSDHRSAPRSVVVRESVDLGAPAVGTPLLTF